MTTATLPVLSHLFLPKRIVLPRRYKGSEELKYLIEQGGERLYKGDLVGAEKFFREAYDLALEQKDKDSQVYCLVSIGFLFLIQGDPEKALSYSERALKLKPAYIAGWLIKGISLDSLKRYEEALSSLERALKIDPKDEAIYFAKGLVLSILGRKEEARLSFKQATELTSEGAFRRLLKGFSLFLLEAKPWESMRCIEQAYDCCAEPYIKSGILWGWSGLILTEAFKALLASDLETAEDWCAQWGYTKEMAKRDGLEQVMEAFLSLLQKSLSPEEREKFPELERRLRQMEDREYRLESLIEAVSRNWPEGLSVVEAIRRERE